MNESVIKTSLAVREIHISVFFVLIVFFTCDRSKMLNIITNVHDIR